MNQYYLLAGPEGPLSSLLPSLAGYDHTNIVSSGGFAMVWVKERFPGQQLPELPAGVSMLGSRYDETWADPAGLLVYNGIYPPEENGSPRPFAVFAGCGEEMGLCV